MPVYNEKSGNWADVTIAGRRQTNKRTRKDGTGSVWCVTVWYLVVLGQYKLLLLGNKWYWVGIGLLCLYVLKEVEIWLDVTIAGRTDEQTNERTSKDRATQQMDHGRLR